MAFISIVVRSIFEKKLRQILLVASLVALFGNIGSAQTTSATDGSTPLAISPGAPIGSYPVSGFESINSYNGNLNFHLQVLGIGGRGGAQTGSFLELDNKDWTVKHRPVSGGDIVDTPGPNRWTQKPGYGPGVLVGRQSGADSWTCGGQPHHMQTLTRLTFIAGDGTEYEFRDQLTNGQPAPEPQCASSGASRGTVFITADGTAATFLSDTVIYDAVAGVVQIFPSGYLMLRDGTRFRIDGGNVTWMRDRNGSRLSFTYDASHRVLTITDALNRQVTYTYADFTTTFSDQVTFKGFEGASRTILINYANLSGVLRTTNPRNEPASRYQIQKYKGLFPELNNASSSTDYNPNVVSSVTLPNGQQYQFFYNCYAELARVTLPTGGALEYDYTAGSGVVLGINPEIMRRVIERRVYSDGINLEGYTTFSDLSGGVATLDQLNGGGTLVSRTKHYFYGDPNNSLYQRGIDYAARFDGREYKTETYAADGLTLLRSEQMTWANRAPVSWWSNPGAADEPPNDPRVADTTSSISDVTPNLISKKLFGYDDSVAFNNQNNMKEYDFGSGAPGALVRETRTTFVTSSTYTDTNVHLRNLASQVSIYDGGGTERARTTFEFDNYTTDANHTGLFSRAEISGLDSSFTTSYTTRGNVTGLTRYLLPGLATVSAYSQYDVAGNIVKTIDPRGNSTNLNYSDCFGAPDGNATSNTAPSELSSASQSSFAFVTSVTNALNQTAYSQYDDYLDRPTKVILDYNNLSAKTQKLFSYDDANKKISSISDQVSFNDQLLKSEIVYDGLGRTYDSRTYETSSAYITVRQSYDALGRKYQVSNPFRSGETIVWTTTAYDALSRITSVTTPDSSVVTTAYSGNAVTVTDQIGKLRRSITDGLGRLTRLDEPDSSSCIGSLGTVSSPNQATSYAYDVLDDLTGVTQGSQSRTFAYDSLKRLTSATNPESGTVTYGYDNNGNLTSRLDARTITMTITYDALNRPIQKSYNDNPQTPTVNYWYDAQTLPSGAPSYSRGYSTGRLVATTYSGGSEGTYLGYDALGRPLRQIQRTGTINYEVDAVYNRGSAITSENYPSGRTVSYDYDQAGRTSGFTGYLGDGVNRTYSTGIIYSALGGMSKEQFGTDTAIYNKLFYNSRGQLSEIRESSSYTGPTDTSWNRGAIINHYSDQCWGACNGTEKKQEHYVPDNEAGSSYVDYTTWFAYDSLNRLQYSNGERYASNGNVVNNQWKQTFIYDRYGNRIIDTNASNTYGSGINNMGFTVSTSTNRLGVPGGQSGSMSYDNAGNLTNDTYTGAGNRTYDAENRITAAWGGNSQWQYYTYNGDGQRVRRKVDGSETWQVYGIGGELVAEYPASGPLKEYGYRNGQLLVTSEGSAGAVTWTSAVGVSVAANNLTKPGSNGWDAGAVSTQTISSGDGYVEFTATETNTHPRLGLSYGNTNQSWDDIDFCIYLQNNGTLDINEGASSRGSFGSYAAGDVFRVAVEGGVVKYRKNGTLLYTSTVTPTYPLLVDTSLYSTNATLTNVRLVVGGNVAWTSAVGVTVSGNSLSRPGANGWDAGAVSTRTIASGDGYVQFTATETNTHRRLGLSYGNTNQSWDDIDFCIYLENNGTVDINEGATTRGSFGSYAAGDVFRVAVENGVVKYRKNGALLYTSTVTPTYPLLVDTSLYSTNATLTNVVMYVGASAANVQWLVTDQLGTPRMVFDKTGSLAAMKRHDYLPFGEEISAFGGRTTGQGYNVSDGIRQQFTSKERDIETGLDYFGYRFYSSTQGRFTSVDPLIDFKRNIVEPQAWNQYQYCVNNPLTRTDPDGQQDSIALNGTTRFYNDLINQGFTQQQAKEIVQVYRQVQAPGNIAAIAGLSLVGMAIAGPEVGAFVLGFLGRNPGITEAVAALALEASGGPPGAVTGAVGSASKTELSLFQRLASEGKNVDVLAAAASKGIQGVRTADIAINGVKVEAKILEGVSGVASSGTVKNAIGRALGQSGNVLIDASGVKLTLQEAQRGAIRVFNADRRLKVVRIIGEDFDITLRRGPQRAQF